MSAMVDSVPIEAAPVVEIDTEASVAYIRISQSPVARASVLRDDELLSTMDLDADGNLVGIEVVWPTEFGIEKLLVESRASVVLARPVLEQTRCVSATRPHTAA